MVELDYQNDKELTVVFQNNRANESTGQASNQMAGFLTDMVMEKALKDRLKMEKINSNNIIEGIVEEGKMEIEDDDGMIVKWPSPLVSSVI